MVLEPKGNGGGSPSVLVIEDEDVIRELLSDFLSEQGYEVTVVEDAKEGLAAFEQARFDAVLVDYGLPGMHGIEVCRKMAAMAPDTALLLMTGMGGLKVAEQEPSIAKVIAKPFDLFAVLRELETLLSSKV